MKLPLTFLAILPLSLATLSFADSLPKQLVMPTDVGKVVITSEPCGIVWHEPLPFRWHAYATELVNGKEVIHPGCWYREEGMQNVNIWFPEISAVGAYDAKLFKPEQTY